MNFSGVLLYYICNDVTIRIVTNNMNLQNIMNAICDVNEAIDKYASDNNINIMEDEKLLDIYNKVSWLKVDVSDYAHSINENVSSNKTL